MWAGDSVGRRIVTDRVGCGPAGPVERVVRCHSVGIEAFDKAFQVDLYSLCNGFNPRHLCVDLCLAGLDDLDCGLCGLQLGQCL